MKTANRQIGIRVFKIPVLHLVVTVEPARAPHAGRLARWLGLAAGLLRAPVLAREQGPGLPALAEHEWRPTLRSADVSKWNA